MHHIRLRLRYPRSSAGKPHGKLLPFIFNFCDAQDSCLCTEGAVAYAAIGGDETTRDGLQNLKCNFDDNSGYNLAYLGFMLVAVGMPSVDIFKCQVQNSSVQISV
jgi:hypothetical protein